MKRTLVMLAACFLAAGTMATAFEPVENVSASLGTHGIVEITFDYAANYQDIKTAAEIERDIPGFAVLDQAIRNHWAATRGADTAGYVLRASDREVFSYGEKNVVLVALTNHDIAARTVVVVDSVCYDNNSFQQFKPAPQFADLQKIPATARAIMNANIQVAYQRRGGLKAKVEGQYRGYLREEFLLALK